MTKQLLDEEVPMSQHHPVHFKVTAHRNNIVVWFQEAETRSEAEALRQRYESVPGTTAEIEEVHDPSETDLTTHTREILDEMNMERSK